MTRAQLSALCLSWLDDEKQGYFTPTDVNTWLNLAQRQVQLMLLQAGQNWYMKPVETLTVLGQCDYVLPVDFVQEHRIEIVITGTGVNEDRRPLKPITTNQQDLVALTLAPPTNYYIKKDRISVSPWPDNQYVMRLYYSPRVSDMTADTDSPDVPEQFMELVAILAAFNGFIKDDRTAENLVAKKNEYIALMKQAATGRTTDQSRQVVISGDYETGNW